MFANRSILEAIWYTVLCAVIATLVSTIVGTITAIGLSKSNKVVKEFVNQVNNLPMLNPEIVTGVSMMLLFVFVGRLIGASNSLSFGTLLIAHVTFNLPYVILNVLPKLNQTDPHLAEAALDLGSTPMEAFFKVTLPSILPGIVSGMIMAFTMSLDDFVISYYTTGSDFQTLPLKIFAMTKKTVKPDMYALSSVIFLTVLVLLLIVNISQIRQEKKDK
jgi:spermidine/putrescine transport system permease protein